MGKDHKKSRREEKDHGSKERERSKTTDTTREREKDRRVSSRDAREDTDEYNNRHKEKEKVKEKDYDHERYRDKEREREKESKDRVKDKDRERQRETEKEHHDRGRERKEKERDRDREKERDRVKHKDREREKDKDRDREKLEREKTQGKDRDRERKVDGDSKERHKDRVSDKYHDEGHDPKENKAIQQDGRDANAADYKQKNELTSDGQQQSSSELERRILQMKEERLKKGSEIVAWVSKSRKLEEKMNAEKEKALHLSRVFEEQDNIVLEEDEEKESAQHTMKDLAGVKVLHGLDKVIEGGAVVLTLKDQSILADGDINDEVDMLENVEIGEQKQRDDAYKAAKKKTGIYDDKFNDEPGAQKKMLPQYDDPVDDEVVTLDESGRFTGKAEKKLEELRKRILGVSTTSGFEDLNSSGKVSSDYYTQEEMLQFKKPKKKKALRKKEKLDLDALEAEAISAGLGAGDLGSRKDGKRQIAKEEQERSEVQSRNNAYQTAFAKAEEASKALRQNISSVKVEEEETPVFGDEDEDLYKSLEKARKLALKQEEKPSGLQAVASLALASRNQAAETQNVTSGEPQENRLVFTEMDEFVAGLQLDGEAHKTEAEDMYMDEDEVVKSSDHERKDEKKDESGGWTEVDETSKVEHPANEEREEIVLDDTIHEAAVGKGLSGALKLLKERGTLKETIEWGGRNMDKKKSKLVGIYENDGTKEIHIERRDEFGRIMTPKEAFRMISHKFHGKEPGKMKKEKRMKQFQDDLKMKQMKNSDTPSQSMERMREAQARLQTPYLVLSGHVKPGQNSDPKSGFATVEDLPGGLTPMLGDRKVEHFLGIKRKADEPGSMGPPKKPKN